MQHTAFNQLNITKQIFLNIYHFPSTLVLLKYQDPFIQYAISESGLSCSFLVWALNFSTGFHWIVNFNTIPYSSKFCVLQELQVCNYHLNIDQDQLNVALTMQALTKHW